MTDAVKSESGTQRVYVASLGLSEGGHYSIEVFDNLGDAKAHAESYFKDDDVDDREWSKQPILEMPAGEPGLVEEAECWYYGFTHDRKGCVREKEVL